MVGLQCSAGTPSIAMRRLTRITTSRARLAIINKLETRFENSGSFKMGLAFYTKMYSESRGNAEPVFSSTEKDMPTTVTQKGQIAGKVDRMLAKVAELIQNYTNTASNW